MSRAASRTRIAHATGKAVHVTLARLYIEDERRALDLLEADLDRVRPEGTGRRTHASRPVKCALCHTIVPVGAPIVRVLPRVIVCVDGCIGFAEECDEISDEETSA